MSTTPPPVNTPRRQRVILIGSGLGIALAILLVVLNLDRRPDPLANQPEPDPDVRELIRPDTLSDEELARSVDEQRVRELQLVAEQGGWIQVADPEDPERLAQRYRFDRLDPDPPDVDPGWVQMIRPRAELFLADRRILTVEGDTGLVLVPNRTLESGRIRGNVLIRLFELPPDADPRDFSTADATPTATLRTEEADYDELVGEITCPRDVRIRSQRVDLDGRNLNLLFNDTRGIIERLTLAEVDAITLRDTAARNEPHTNARVRSTPAETDPTQFYLMRMNERVVIRQEQRTARGDELQLTFSPDVDVDDAPTTVTRRPGLPARLALAALGLPEPRFAHVPLDPTPTDPPTTTRITFDGPLVMTPADRPPRDLGPEDYRVELRGRPVTLDDVAEAATLTCGRLHYTSTTRTAVLRADPDTPVRMTSPDLELTGDHFELDQDRNRGRFRSPGTLRRVVAADQPDAPPAERLRIRWAETMDVRFAPGEDGSLGPMERVIFKGDVDVRSPDGAMTTDFVDLRVEPGPDDQLRPTRLLARGNIMTESEERILWADELDLVFADPPDDNDAATDDQPADTNADDLFGKDVAVDTVDARGNIQVLMPDGSRAFADALHGDGAAETLELTGNDVMVLAGQLLLDRGKKLVLRQSDRTATVPGPGSLIILDEPLPDAGRQRIPKPDPAALPAEPVARARWNDSLRYDSRVNDDAGAVDLRGSVVASTRQLEPREENAMQGDTLRLEVDLPADPTLRDPDPDRDAFDAGQGVAGRRRLARFIARGSARLESRAWADRPADEQPRLLHVTGDHIEYDDRSGAAAVYGPGEFLVRETWSPEPVAPEDEAVFGRTGTSLFTWQRGLRLNPRPGDRVEVIMEGRVEGIHQSLAGRTSTLTGERFVADLDRAPAFEPSPRTAGNADVNTATTLDFASADMSLRRLRGSGGIFVDALRYDIDCDRFDYNIARQIAVAEANAGRTVTVLEQDARFPVRAERVVWNLDPRVDTITIDRARGTTGR